MSATLENMAYLLSPAMKDAPPGWEMRADLARDCIMAVHDKTRIVLLYKSEIEDDSYKSTLQRRIEELPKVEGPR